jgi:hypothetical protein
MNHHQDSNRNRKLPTLGESTKNMLSFQDMMESKQSEGGRPFVRRPPLRMHRSMEQPIFNRPPQKLSRQTPKTHADISLPPLTKPISRCYSSPPVLAPREEKIWHRVVVDVAPGHSVPLCGAEETKHALQKNCIVHTDCSCCGLFLYCINSASIVLCPSCRSISPVETNSQKVTESLGLGLTVEHVLEECGK